MMSRRFLLVAIGLAATIIACNSYSGKPKDKDNASHIGRYIALSSSGTKIDTILVDTSTGSTWILKTEGNQTRWEIISGGPDNVISFERGPDGKLRVINGKKDDPLGFR